MIGVLQLDLQRCNTADRLLSRTQLAVEKGIDIMLLSGTAGVWVIDAADVLILGYGEDNGFVCFKG